jgi:hypothetical protein
VSATSTPTAPTIVEALSNVMRDVQAVSKSGRNTAQNYVFRGIDATVNAVGPALRAHCVIVLPEVLDVAYRDVTTTGGKPSRECTVKVRYTFHGPAGDSLTAVTVGESLDFGDKGAPKAMSVAFRICLLQALCIPTDEQDPDEHSYERASKPQWDPAGQEALVAGWTAEIEDAADADALTAVAKNIKAATRTPDPLTRLSPMSFEKLSKAGAARRAEFDREKVPA